MPTSQLYGATIARNPAAGRRVALTYDDGPNPRYTPELLELFERHGAHATFFQIGKWVEREPALAREVQAAGHAIGNHTFTHPTLALCSSARVTEELARCHAASTEAGVHYAEVDGAQLMRCPWGRRRPGTLRAIRAAGYVPVQWSITGWDWQPRRSAENIAEHGFKATRRRRDPAARWRAHRAAGRPLALGGGHPHDPRAPGRRGLRVRDDPGAGQAGALTALPISASSARSSEAAMQVKMGVSDSV